MIDSSFFYFYGLRYNKPTLLNRLSEMTSEWSTYGPKSKKTLFVKTIPLDDASVEHVVSQFKPGLVDDVMFLMTRRGGEVLPHKDTRPTSLLLPLSGDFVNSSTEFYNSYIEKFSVNLVGTDISAPSAVGFSVGPPDQKVSYSNPICINAHTIHAVKNYTDSHRIVLSLSLNKDWEFAEIRNRYLMGELLL